LYFDRLGARFRKTPSHAPAKHGSAAD
jgi:hypothetical protein